MRPLLERRPRTCAARAWPAHSGACYAPASLLYLPLPSPTFYVHVPQPLLDLLLQPHASIRLHARGGVLEGAAAGQEPRAHNSHEAMSRRMRGCRPCRAAAAGRSGQAQAQASRPCPTLPGSKKHWSGMRSCEAGRGGVGRGEVGPRCAAQRSGACAPACSSAAPAPLQRRQQRRLPLKLGTARVSQGVPHPPRHAPCPRPRPCTLPRGRASAGCAPGGTPWSPG